MTSPVIRTLTNAELRALNSQSIDLVAGVSGKVIVPTLLVLVYHYGTTPTDSGGQEFCLGQKGVYDPFLQVTDASWFRNAQTDGFAAANTLQGPPVGPLAQFVGTPLQLYLNAGDLEDGDGTLTATVHYVEVSAG